jgi:hypothetical protein
LQLCDSLPQLLQLYIMALEITGRLYEKYDVQQISQTFSKREFVLEISEQAANGMTYTNYAAFQLVNAQTSLIDNFQLGDMVTVNFNIRGNKWEKDGQVRYITNLNAWRVQAANLAGGMPNQPVGQPSMPQNNFQQPAAPSPAPNFGNNSSDDGDDLPF